MSRTFTGTWLFVPTRRTSRRSSTRRSFGCRSMLSSPISSRKTVPPAAASKTPSRDDTAPVKAPRSWPKSSLSRSCGGMAPQSTTRNGFSRRGLPRWMASAEISLPVPVSPSSRIVASLPEALPSTSKTACMAVEWPTMRPNRSRSKRAESARLAPASASNRTDPSPAASAERAPCGPFPMGLVIDRWSRFLDHDRPRGRLYAASHSRPVDARFRRRASPEAAKSGARGDCGGAQQARLGVRDDEGGQALDEGVQATLALEGLSKPTFLQVAEDARRDATCDVHAARREHAEPQVAGDGAQHGAEEREGHLADRVGAGEPAARDLGGGVAARAVSGQHGRRLGLDERAAGRLLGQEPEDVDEAVAREHALARDAPVLGAEVLEEARLERRARREVGVAALRRDDLVAIGCLGPEEKRLAEAGAGPEHGDGTSFHGRAAAERDEIGGADDRHAQGRGAEVVDERDALDPEAHGERAPVDDPGQVRRAGAVVLDGPRDAEAGRVDARALARALAASAALGLGEGGAQEGLGDLVERGLRLRGRRALEEERELPPPAGRRGADLQPRAGARGANLKEREPRVGSPDVTCENDHVTSVEVGPGKAASSAVAARSQKSRAGRGSARRRSAWLGQRRTSRAGPSTFDSVSALSAPAIMKSTSRAASNAG